MRALLAIIVLALLTLLMSVVGYFSPTSKADEIETAINAAYQTEGVPATAVMDGNVVKIAGEMLGDTQKGRALAIAEAARCVSCLDNSIIWHEVEDGTTLVAERADAIETVSPYTFSVRYNENGTATLNGYVPSEAARTRILAEAERHFPGNVVDNVLRVANGQPNDAWADAISLNLNELHLLERGRLSINSTDVVLSGRAATVAVRDEIRSLLDNAPDGYNQVLNIEVIGTGIDNVGELTNQELCQELIDDLNQDNEIQFDTDSATLRPGRPQEVLAVLAGGMNQCPAFNLRVEGHASENGDPDYNMTLSRDRAAAVVDYLETEGEIRKGRLSSQGYGETQPKVQTADPTSDLAVNRRIEFIVSR